MKVKALAVSAATAGILLAGCGSSNKSLSYSAFSNQANAICGTVNSQTTSATKNLNATANAANAKILGNVLTIENNAIARIKKLNGPSALNSARDTFLTAVNKGIDDVKAAESAANSGNSSAYIAAIQKIASIGDSTNTLGSKLGAPNCASATNS